MTLQTRCLTETFFGRALQRAKDLDDILSKTGTLVGPLHGLPISFKVRQFWVVSFQGSTY
jgi:Asp-tRNA(Asn)/Glu-tRNA(Gln) amidotransferase A subunit family amidase